MGRNANFTGEGFAQQTFNVQAMSKEEYEKWISEVKDTADTLTEDKFEELLNPGHLGQLTFNGTHLGFSPPPHDMKKSTSEEKNEDTENTKDMDMEDMDMEGMDH